MYLPITLLLLFGQPDSPPHLKAVLDHTMQLVCAVLLACKRTTNSSRIERYRHFLRRYIEKLPALYPDLGCESIHHMAFHIYDFLKLFGPVHSWWAFPFEHLIGQLQHMPTNHKFGTHASLCEILQRIIHFFLGQLEKTIHQAFLRGANLRHWLSRPNCPEIIYRCRTLFNKLYGDKPDGIAHLQELALTEDDPLKPSQLQDTPEELWKLIHRSKVILHARYRADGVIYARAGTHFGNSLVLFYPHGNRTSAAIPGSIKYIYRLDGHVRFAVRRYTSPSLGLDVCLRSVSRFSGPNMVYRQSGCLGGS